MSHPDDPRTADGTPRSREAPTNRRPRDLAVFLEHLRGGGAEHNILRLAAGFAQRGHRIRVIVADASQTIDAWVPPDMEIVDLAAGSLSRSIMPLSRWLRNERPDLLISAVSGANIVALIARRLASRQIPVVVTERNTPSAQRRQARGLRRRHITPWLMRRCYPSASSIVGVSKGVTDDVISFTGVTSTPARPILAIPNPVVDDELERSAEEPLDASWNDKLGDRRVIISVGRLEIHKGHDVLLDAFAKLRQQHDDVVLAILGEGPQRDAIQTRIADLNLNANVVMPGFQANPFAWMKRSELLVMTSRYEGLPTVLIEALACGARVVATDCPSGSAEILNHGRWGQLVPVDDVDAIATAMDAELRQGRWPQPPNAALVPYRPATVLDQWEQLIDRVVPS